MGVAFLNKYPHNGGHMKLADFLEAHELSYAEFARSIRAKSPETVRRYAIEGRVPRPQMLERIIEATDGKVTANDFFGVVA